MKITSKTSVAEVCTFLKCIDFWDQIDQMFTTVEIPEMTYGQRIDLSEIKTWNDLLFLPQRLFKGLSDDEILKIPFYDAYNFGMSILKELNRQAKRDMMAFKYTPSNEEIKAGYYELDHGIFGIVDKIALRLHIPHDEVFNLPEKRVFAMLKIDHDRMMYEKKYNEIISKKK